LLVFAQHEWNDPAFLLASARRFVRRKLVNVDVRFR